MRPCQNDARRAEQEQRPTVQTATAPTHLPNSQPPKGAREETARHDGRLLDRRPPKNAARSLSWPPRIIALALAELQHE
eukprot:4573031-Pyramimonas_sp.AAC.1